MFSFQSCEKEDEYEIVISDYGDDDSHNKGMDCMTCHIPGKGAEGNFSVAGSIYNTSIYQNTDVILSTEADAQGEIVAIVKVDALGNFYTTQTIDFGQGLYTTVRSGNRDLNMQGKISSGNCNSCHGNNGMMIDLEF